MAKISINMSSGEVKRREITVGIDLGTTHSLVAFVENDEPVMIRDGQGKSALVPSIVHFPEQGGLVVGEEAKTKLISHPESTIYSVKRLLGKSYEDLSQNENLLSYSISNEEADLVQVKVNDKFYSPIELSAEILRYLKRRVENEMKVIVTRAVITVPAYFNDSQRQATRDAGKLAGMEVLRIINEPTAAALAYRKEETSDAEETVLVYDLGGGTFDISVLRLMDGIYDVLSTNGDTYLGGDDIDQLIMNHWMQDHEKWVDIEDSIVQSFRMKAEIAKKTVSGHQDFNDEVSGLSLSENKFNELIQPLIEKTIKMTKRAIEDAEISLDEVDKIILVGGSTRIPLIKKRLEESFGVTVKNDIDPDTVVALGAAIQADILSNPQNSGSLLLDVTPLSLGIETVGGLMDTIIPRNSKIPLKLARSYTTSVDGQANLKVSVYQGERELVEHNRKLGEFILSDIPPMAAGMPKLKILFTIDVNGILNVEAMEERSGVSTGIEIRSQYGVSEAEMGRMLKESIEHADQDMQVKGIRDAQNEARALVLATDKFMDQNADILSSEEVRQLKEMKANLEQVIGSEEKDAIRTSMDALNNYSRPLAERAMDHALKNAMQGKKIG